MSRGKKIKKFATIDCETNPFEFEAVIKPFIWGYYDETGFSVFYDTAEFVEFIKTQDRIIYAHNGGKFDFHFLLDHIPPQDNVMVINGRIAKIKIGEAELRDSYLLLPVPLSAYQKDEIDYNIFREELRDKGDNPSLIKTYLFGDCKYLYDILQVQFDIYGQKLTLASSAFDFWHSNFSPLKNKPKTSERFFEEFKPFYYGGRVECFEKGVIEKEFTVHDINSAYPWAMQFQHPIGDEYKFSRKLPDNFDLSFIDLVAESRGAFPYRCPETKRLIFPNDGELRRFKVTSWELKKALELFPDFKIDKVYECFQFLNSINFKDYVDHFYNEKSLHKEGDAAKYLLAKLYMNSLYGKFGQSPIDHREYSLINPWQIEEYKNDNFAFEGILGGNALMSCPIAKHKKRFFNVATAASVTGAVRAYLFEHINKAQGVLYCDTDSIAAEKFNGSIGSELGQWDCEGEFTRAAIGGKKLYAFERKIPKKGVKFKISSKGAKLTEKEIFSIASGNEVCYNSIAPTFSINKAPVYITRNIRLT
jgi:hypothetical protein